MNKVSKNIARLALFLAAGLSLLSAPASADGTDTLSLSAGYFDIFHGDKAVDFRVEYRFGEGLLWQIKPFLGVEGTSEGSFYGLGGLYYDWGFKPHWYLTPSFGAGVYAHGGGKDLDNLVEFRSQLELAYEFRNFHRVSAGLSHISNGGFGEIGNPGVEILGLYYHIPMP